MAGLLGDSAGCYAASIISIGRPSFDSRAEPHKTADIWTGS